MVAAASGTDRPADRGGHRRAGPRRADDDGGVRDWRVAHPSDRRGPTRPPPAARPASPGVGAAARGDRVRRAGCRSRRARRGAGLGPAPTSDASAAIARAPTATLSPAAPADLAPSAIVTASPTIEPTPEPTPTLRPTPDTPSTPRPTPVSTPRPATSTITRTPAQTVADFYSLVVRHDFDAAARLWSPRMRDRYPPRQYIDGRFAPTTAIDIRHLSTTSESTAGGPRRSRSISSSRGATDPRAAGSAAGISCLRQAAG